MTGGNLTTYYLLKPKYDRGHKIENGNVWRIHQYAYRGTGMIASENDWPWMKTNETLGEAHKNTLRQSS